METLRAHRGATTPFWVCRGYGLHNEEPLSQRERAGFPTSIPTPTAPFLRGSNRTFPHSSMSGYNQPTTTTMRSPLGGSRRTSPRTYESGTFQFPPIGYQMPQNLQGPATQNQEGHYPSSPLTTPRSTYQDQGRTPSPLTSGQMTPTNQTHPLIRQLTPTPSMTQSTREGTAIPSMPEG